MFFWILPQDAPSLKNQAIKIESQFNTICTKLPKARLAHINPIFIFVAKKIVILNHTNLIAFLSSTEKE